VLRVREPGHRIFRTPARDVHVHVWPAGGQDERLHLMFRDWLRSNPADRREYEQAKRELAGRWQDMNYYARAKDLVIARIMKRADELTPPDDRTLHWTGRTIGALRAVARRRRHLAGSSAAPTERGLASAGHRHYGVHGKCHYTGAPDRHLRGGDRQPEGCHCDSTVRSSRTASCWGARPRSDRPPCLCSTAHSIARPGVSCVRAASSSTTRWT
jgi:hypothetical protein